MPPGAPAETPSIPGVVRPLVIEAEDFEFKAHWMVAEDSANSGDGHLIAGAGEGDALTVINVPAGGTYDVWTRSFDFAEVKPGTRRYRVVVDDVEMPSESGGHGKQGWEWEKPGTASLAPGRHVIALRNTTKDFARADVIVLSPQGFDLSRVPLKSLGQYLVKPVPALEQTENTGSEPPPGKTREVAALESDSIRMAFQELADPDGRPRIIRQVSVKDGTAWRPVPGDPSRERLFALFNTSADIVTTGFFPSWKSEAPVRFTSNGKTYEALQDSNPFTAGTQIELKPTAIRSSSPDAVEVICEGKDGTGAVATWTLQGETQRLSLKLTAGRTGFYSVGFSPFSSWKKSRLMAVQLPPVFQMQRLPDHPIMVTSNTTPHALALAEIKPEAESQSFTFVAAAEPADLGFDWSRRGNSRYGFSLLNAQEQVQPTVFHPVLDLVGSKLEAGQSLEARFVAMSLPGDWKAGLEKASDKIFGVTDYREPVRSSLTEAALNMIDLLKDADASGWDARLKGNYNIESLSTVTQASPLTCLSVAMLTRDPGFYAARALPTLEYTLSRYSAHYAGKQVDVSRYLKKEDVGLVFPGRSNGVKYWQGVYDLTLRLNPWIVDLVHQNSDLLARKDGDVIPQWSEMLGEYQIHPSPEKLAEIRSACDAWIAREFDTPQTLPKGLQPFYNFSFYPYWWDLLDLYELTGEKKYLNAAETGAFHTIAGLWSHPSIPSGNITVNGGGQFKGDESILWKNDRRDRRGFPRTPGDTPERQAPAWEVAQMGLGLEQPTTFFGGVGKLQPADWGLRNILNSVWAPSLLRLHEFTGREIYKTYARNSIIARFSNYPGYYLKGFTDVELDPDYPRKGPDVSSIYYHHMPVHLAFTLDYIFTEAEQMSQGAVKFPWVKQQGYVWFTSREYGSGPGRIYEDDGMWPWLDRKAFSVDSPQINYFGASGSGRFDVVVSNSSHHDAGANLTLNLEKTGVAAGEPYQFLINGKVAETGRSAAKIPFHLPQGAMGVFRFRSDIPTGFAHAAPLRTLPVSLDLQKPWGKLQAVRIRSPFGHDSLYVFATGTTGSSATIKFDDDKLPEQSLAEPPFEFTVYPIPMSEGVTFRVDFANPDGSRFETNPITLPGTPKAP